MPTGTSAGLKTVRPIVSEISSSNAPTNPENGIR